MENNEGPHFLLTALLPGYCILLKFVLAKNKRRIHWKCWMIPAKVADDSALVQTSLNNRDLAVFQVSIEFLKKGYRLFGKSLGSFLKMGRDSVRIG